MVVGAFLIGMNAIVGIWGLIAYRRDAPPGGLYCTRSRSPRRP